MASEENTRWYGSDEVGNLQEERSFLESVRGGMGKEVNAPSGHDFSPKIAEAKRKKEKVQDKKPGEDRGCPRPQRPGK